MTDYQYHPANKSQLNQAALKAILELGEIPEMNLPHVVQLSIWFLESYQLEGNWGDAQADLLLMVGSAAKWRTEEIEKAFAPAASNVRYLLRSSLKEINPKELAMLLTEEFYDNLSTEYPELGPPLSPAE